MYIGLTNNLHRRYLDHLSAALNKNNKDHNQPIHCALRKYGEKNFEFNTLEKNIETLKLAKQREQYWIAYYDTYNNQEHYNLTPGGDAVGDKNVHLGEEHGMAKLTENDVKYCRECYKKGLRSRNIYNEQFSDKISYGGFLRMWHGSTWKHIMPEVFENNPHRAKYGAADRDILLTLWQESGLSVSAFSKTDECYVGYATFYKMVHEPQFYDNK